MTVNISRFGITVCLMFFLLFFPVARAQSYVQYSINATAGVLFDCNTAQFLVEQNADEFIAPASFTKLMTLYVALDAVKKGMISHEDLVMVSAKAWKTGGSRMFIEVNTRVPVSELLQGIAVVSGNDACVALAEHVSGKEEVFVREMNRCAERLGLSHTVFKDPHGLSPDQQTTARDMALLGYHYLKEFPYVVDIHSLTTYTYNKITQSNRNGLLNRDEGVDGLKTGYLDPVTGYHLLATAEREGRRLIAVVMGAKTTRTRENEALKLLNFGFRNFEIKEACAEGQVVTTIPVKQGKQNLIDVLATRTVTVTAFRQNTDAVKLVKNIPEFVNAPLAQGETVGTLHVEVDGRVLHQVDLIAEQHVEKSLFAYWRIGLAILGILLIISVILRISKKNKKQAISG